MKKTVIGPWYWVSGIGVLVFAFALFFIQGFPQGPYGKVTGILPPMEIQPNKSIADCQIVFVDERDGGLQIPINDTDGIACKSLKFACDLMGNVTASISSIPCLWENQTCECRPYSR